MKTHLAYLGTLILLSAAAWPGTASAQDSEQQEKLVRYSLYYEEFKNKNYADALPNLRWILKNAPGFPRSNDKNFERAVETYREMGLSAEDDSERRVYLDSALVMFDTAVPTIQEIDGQIDEFEWTLKKGSFIFENLEHLSDLEPEIANQYKAAWDMDPSRLDPYYLEYVLADLVQNQEDKDAAVAYLDEIEEKRGGEEAIDALLNKWRGGLFTSPEERYDFVKSRLEAEPDNIEFLEELLDLALDLGYRDEVYELAERVLQIKPSAATFRAIGIMKLEDGEAEEALDMFQQSLGLAGSPEEQRDTYFNMGIAEQQLGRLSKARTAFRKAVQIDPSFGRAYLSIGDLYVAAISNCGTFERDDRAVYWLVTDYYARAKSVDPALAGSADQRIRQYRKFYPDREMMFFAKLEAGQRYEVNSGCYGWINESTTVKNP